MKAVRIHAFGDESVLTFEDAPDPVPGQGEAVVAIGAIGVNHVELDIRAGISRMDLALPAILGLEFAGTVAWLPDDAATNVKVGDSVAVAYTVPCWTCHYCRTGRDNICRSRALFGVNRPGGYAELASVPVGSLIPLNPGMSLAAAAASQIAFSTAWHVLMTRGELTSGQTVLVHAAGSGIGSAAIQIASMIGARVIATASTAPKRERAARYADATVDYTKPGWPSEVRALTGGEGVDVVMSHVGGEEIVGSLEAVRDDGIVVVVGGHSGEVVPLDIIPFFRRQVRLVGSSRATRAELELVLDLVARGRLEPVVHREFPLSEAARGHAELRDRHVYGKVLLRP